MEIALGILLLIGLVMFKTGLHYWQVSRLKAQVELAQAAMQRGDWPQAQQVLEKCVKKHPGIIPLRHHLAIALAKRDMQAEAEEQFRFALDLEPKHPTSNFSYALFLASHFPDRYEDAAKYFSTAVQGEPELLRILQNSTELEAFRQSPAYACLGGETR